RSISYPKEANSTQRDLSSSSGIGALNEVGMPALPMEGFHNLVAGVTTVLPAFDNSDFQTALRPSVIVNQILGNSITRVSAAPFFLNALAENLLQRDLRAKSVRKLVASGAPVPARLCEKIVKAFPNANCQVVYGAQKIENLASVEMPEILASTGEGYLV